MTDDFDTPKAAPVKLPHTRHSAYRILVAMIDGGGTFWQICERAKIDVETHRAELNAREVFSNLQTCGHINANGINYTLSRATRAALVPPTPYVGKVAGPYYRGPNQAMPVTIYRREVRV